MLSYVNILNMAIKGKLENENQRIFLKKEYINHIKFMKNLNEGMFKKKDLNQEFPRVGTLIFFSGIIFF